MICDFEISKIVFEYCRPTPDKYDGFILNLLYNWQTLIAGSFALLGGALLWYQTSIQKQDIEQKALQQRAAARMRLPHALSDMHRYLDAYYNIWESKDTLKRAYSQEGTLDCLIENGKHADKDTFVTLSKLVILLQAFESRLDDTSPLNCHDNMIIDIMCLMHYIDTLYIYGRFRVDKILYKTPTKDNLTSALQSRVYMRFLPPEDPIRARLEQALKLSFF